mgnify:CR=1 FL=1
MGSRILVIDGHPDPAPERFCHALAEAYVDGARSTGRETRLVGIADADFPLLRSARDFSTPPDTSMIARARDDVLWADHLVFVFPLWLGGAPALLRAFLKQMATGAFVADISRSGVQQKLKGRSARLIVTMGMPALVYRLWFQEHGVRNIMQGVLGLGGIAPIRRTLFGMIEGVGEQVQRQRLDEVRRLGRDGR